MSVSVGWVVTLLLLLSLGIIAGALLSLSALPFLATPQAPLRRVEPAARFWILGALAIVPLLAAMTVILIAFGPSLLHAAGIATDHCAGHVHTQGYHLCFLHFPPPQLNAALIGATCLVLAWPAIHIAGDLRATLRSQLQTRSLLRLSKYDEQRRVYLIDAAHPLALVAGLFRPRIIVSEHLEETLSGEQFTAVLAHERAHQRRRDGMVLFFLHLAMAFHFPPVRRVLRDALQLAMEQACDEAAARIVDDRVTVAETLLALERAHQGVKPTAATTPAMIRFQTHPIEARVKGLLRGQWIRPRWPLLGAMAVALSAVLLAQLPRLHHLLEHGLAHIIF